MTQSTLILWEKPSTLLKEKTPLRAWVSYTIKPLIKALRECLKYLMNGLKYDFYAENYTHESHRIESKRDMNFWHQI